MTQFTSGMRILWPTDRAHRTPQKNLFFTWTSKSLSGPVIGVFLGWLIVSAVTGASGKYIKLPQETQLFGHSLVKSIKSLNKAQGQFMNKTLVQPNTTRNVTTQLGQPIYLHCIVENLQDNTVSWIRLRDFHLLTVGLYTYTSDNRFSTSHNVYSKDWILQIKYPQLHDEGLYECQINADPPISHYVYLRVVVPRSKIIGGNNIYVEVGNELNLTCVISQSAELPSFVFWYHDDRMINFDFPRGKITVQKAEGDTAVSRLHISETTTSDTGNYSCCPSNADRSSVFVHVLRGEKRLAVQNDAGAMPISGVFVPRPNIILLIPVFVLYVQKLFLR